MEKSTKIGLGIFFVIVVAGFMFLGGDKAQITGNVVGTGESFVEVTTTIKGLQYNPDTITLNEGDNVKLTVINKDSFGHAFNLKQFGITGSIRPGSTKTVEFIATKTNGQAIYTCSQEHGETLTFIIN